MGEVLYPPRAIETYTNSLLENWNTVAIRGRQPRLVLDYSSSAPAFFFSSTLDKLGVETISINNVLRRPQAHSASWPKLCRALAATGGGDGEGNGGRPGRHPRPGSRIPLRRGREGRAHPRLSVCCSCCFSTPLGRREVGVAALPLHATRHAEQVVASTGVTIRRTKYSKAFVMAEAARPNTIFAASADGGYIYPAVLPSMDGLFALGKVLELVSTSDAPLSHVTAQVAVAHLAHLQTECPWDLKGRSCGSMTEKLREGRVSLVDGIKVFLDSPSGRSSCRMRRSRSSTSTAEAGDDGRAGASRCGATSISSDGHRGGSTLLTGERVGSRRGMVSCSSR